MIKKLMEEGIFVNYIELAMELWGVVYPASDGNYYIGVNDRLAPNIQAKVINHELQHIRDDLPCKGHLIGVDMQHYNFEKKEDGDIHKLFDDLYFFSDSTGNNY